MAKADFSVIGEGIFTTVDGREFKIKDYFTEKDFVQGEDGGVFVRHAGLLRVLKKVFSVVHYNANLLQSPDKNNAWCSVVRSEYKVCAKDNLDKFYIWSAVADCNTLNSMEGFERYTTTVAETRASARAVRNLLGVEFCSKEEIADSKNESDDNQPIQNNQLVLLETKFMREMKVTLEDISKIVGKDVKTLQDLTKSEAADVIGKLNSKRSKKKENE